MGYIRIILVDLFVRIIISGQFFIRVVVPLVKQIRLVVIVLEIDLAKLDVDDFFFDDFLEA